MISVMMSSSLTDTAILSGGVLGAILSLALIMFLSTKEVADASEGEFSKSISSNLNFVIPILLMTFLLIVGARVLEVL